VQIVRLNCAFSRNLGRGDDVDGLGAIMRGILNIEPLIGGVNKKISANVFIFDYHSL